MLSLVIPVYRNEGSLDRLLAELVKLHESAPGRIEVVFVVDGSPDCCYDILKRRLPTLPLRTQLVALSRNFGSFPAISAGLACGRGDYFACIAADLQEPPGLALELLQVLEAGAAEVVFGYRTRRKDPLLTRLSSGLFWYLYRRFVNEDVPVSGIDVFGCTARVRDELLRLREPNTNLVVLLLWLGFRRAFVSYERQQRIEGRSAWTLRKRLRYAFDSIFNFTDLPLRLLLAFGVIGTVTSAAASLIVLTRRLLGDIEVPGYTPTVLAICFFGGLTTLGLGIIGQYLWLSLSNARRRPNYVITSRDSFGTVSHYACPQGTFRQAVAR